MILLIFGAIIGNLINAQVSYQDCKSLDFKPKACAIQKASFELSEKPFLNKSK